MQGLGKTCLYCGDGINDLIALAGADVGVSVGASDAAAAAVFSTKRFSIAGVASVLQVIVSTASFEMRCCIMALMTIPCTAVVVHRAVAAITWCWSAGLPLLLKECRACQATKLAAIRVCSGLLSVVATCTFLQLPCNRVRICSPLWCSLSV